MVDRDDPPQNEAPTSAPATYTGRFRLDRPDDDSDDILQPLSYVPGSVARKLMKGSKRGKNSSSMASQNRSSQTPNPPPQHTYRIIRGPPSAEPSASRSGAPSHHMPSRSISVPSESEPPSSSVTRVPSPDWEAGSSRLRGPSSGSVRGSPSPRRRGTASKLRNVIAAPMSTASPQYETEAEFPPSSPYAPHPPSSPAPYAFPPRSAHLSVIMPARHASLPPSSSHHSVQPLVRHPSLPPTSPSGEHSVLSRHPSVQPSTPPPSYPPRAPHPSLYTPSPTPYAVHPSSLAPRSHHPSLMPRLLSQPPQPSETPPPLPPSAPPMASSSSASTSTSTSTNTAASASRDSSSSASRAVGGSGDSGGGGSGRPPLEATIHCHWETCTATISGVQNFGKHLKKDHKVPVAQHGRQSGPIVQCKWVRCGAEVAGLELYVHILQVHLKFGYQCRGLQKDGRTRCEYRPIRLDTLERHYKAVHPGVTREWDETMLLPP